MVLALEIRKDRTPTVLRRLAKEADDVRIARRILAIANALDGMNRDDAARSAGMDRQTLRDWVLRYNAHGVDGLAAFALILPYVNTEAMQIFLDRFAAEIAEDEHVAMVLDQAGWHGAKALVVPNNITLLALPPNSPELNPVERVWLHLKERFLSHRLHADYEAIADAAERAWNRLRAETGRLTSLCSYPWISQVK